jgi:hypothetical protein
MRVTQSFSLSLQEIEQLNALIGGENKSKYVGLLIQSEYQRVMKNKLLADGQTILETHIVPSEIRLSPMNRFDGKCNPHHVKGKCVTCWSDE